MRRIGPSARVLAALCALAGLCAASNDRVLLKSGKELVGRLLYLDEATLVLRQDKRDTTLARADVERVEARLTNLVTLLENAERADLAKAEVLELLAAQAEEMGLSGEAQVFWWRLVRLDPGHRAARAALGHEARGSGWSVPLGNRRVDEARRFELARDWGSAWELTSLHYRLRTNLALEAALAVLLDLERIYLGFYALFGADLRLFDVTNPLAVHLHAERSSYPESANEWGSYDTEADVVHVNAAAGLDYPTLAHELVHQLLYDTAFRERGQGSGSVPAWLDEGLADYVAGCIARAPQVLFEAGRVRTEHVRTHAQAKRALDLTRVLSLSHGDYQASSERLLKYAQSYTLVHFLVHGGQGRYRAGLTDFLRKVYEGKGSSTDLKKALGVEWRELEREWQAYVSRLAR
jgi:hypothetical protein